MLDLLREQEKTSFPSRESSFSGWEQSAVSSNLIATIRASDNFGNQTNVTSSCSIALQTNLRSGLFVGNNAVNWVDPEGKNPVGAVIGMVAGGIAGAIGAQAANAGTVASIAGAFGGAIAGGAVGALDPNLGLGSQAAAGALGGMLGNAIAQGIGMANDPIKTFNNGEFIGSGIGGALGGLAGGVLGSVSNSVAAQIWGNLVANTVANTVSAIGGASQSNNCN